MRKDQDLFRTVVSCFEQKQFKRGLKAADSILKKHPNHGETLAMKGIILNSMDRKGEAYDFVKQGLRNDVKSPICWHVFGLLYRSDGNYKEAAKCYLNALRIDSENQNILRDLSWLQIQVSIFSEATNTFCNFFTDERFQRVFIIQKKDLGAKASVESFLGSLRHCMLLHE